MVQHRQTGAFIAFELAEMRVILSDSNEVPIEFRPHDFREPLDLTLANVWEYLGSEAIQLPQNARMPVFNKSVFTNLLVDTVGHGTPSSFPSRQFRLRVLDGNTGNILATLDTSSASGTVSVSVVNFAGQHIIFRPNVTLTGVPLTQLSIVLVISSAFPEAVTETDSLDQQHLCRHSVWGRISPTRSTR